MSKQLTKKEIEELTKNPWVKRVSRAMTIIFILFLVLVASLATSLLTYGWFRLFGWM